MDMLNIRAGETYQQLGAVTAEDWSSGSSVHFGWLALQLRGFEGDS